MPKLDLDAIPPTNRSSYPPPHNQAVAGSWKRRIGPVAGLTELGATHVVLEPGAWSSQRHWHDSEDEMLVMLTGEAVLIEDEGRTLLRAGDICAWPKGMTNGHHLCNESDAECSFIAFSAGVRGRVFYPDVDMLWGPDGITHRDGSPYYD